MNVPRTHACLGEDEWLNSKVCFYYAGGEQKSDKIIKLNTLAFQHKAKLMI